MEAIPIRRASTDVAALMRSVMDSLIAQAQALEVELTIVVDGELTKLEIDPEKIAFAVTTLVGNSLRHVRRGSRHLPGGSIQVRMRMDNDALSISVIDDGAGIPSDKVPSLFAREEGKLHAAGLALMMVHDVVTAHGGTVEVKSTTEGSEHGTTITLRLPPLRPG